MTLRILFFLFLIFLIGCNTDSTSAKTSPIDSSTKIVNTLVRKPDTVSINAELLKAKLKGAWTDSNSENAIFDVNDTSFYYVDEDQNAYCPYSLVGDSITIKYPSYTYTGRITFNKDTLIMDSKEDPEAKFWKFRK